MKTTVSSSDSTVITCFSMCKGISHENKMVSPYDTGELQNCDAACTNYEQFHYVKSMQRSMRKSFKEKQRKQGCQKGLKQVADIHCIALLHPYFTLIYKQAIFMQIQHIKPKQGCRSALYWMSATCFNPFLASLLALLFFKTFLILSLPW